MVIFEVKRKKKLQKNILKYLVISTILFIFAPGIIPFKQIGKMKQKHLLLALLLFGSCLTAGAQSKYDLNDDGVVDAADVVVLINVILGKAPEQESNAPAGAKAVDLGLPSGTKWANMNVGAEKPEDYGLYFAWGETQGYTSDTSDGRSFDWASYKWMNPGQPSGMQVNKYQGKDGQIGGCWYDSERNFIGDGKTTLDLADDAANANWGGSWRMPTNEEIEELIENTTSEWTTVNGVNGFRFTSKTNGNSIFLPAAGLRNASYSPDDRQGAYGYYNSSSLSKSSSDDARILQFKSGGYVYAYYGRRRLGHSVRPVLSN